MRFILPGNRAPKGTVPGGIVSLRTVVNLPAIQHSLQHTVPEDLFFKLTAASICVTPGAAQFIDRMSVEIFNASSFTIATLAEDNVNRGAAVEANLNWSGEAWVAPGEFVFLRALFNAGAAINFGQLSLHGIYASAPY